MRNFLADGSVFAQAWSSMDILCSRFQAGTGQSANSMFGAYVIQPIGDSLLVGLSNQPGNYDGALITRSSDGSTFTDDQMLDEQGVHDMLLQGSDVWVPGTDPTDDWTLGNLYHRDSIGAWSKLRTLPLAIHALGCWHDGMNLWIAAGCHTGDNVTWRGRILKSTDGGLTWIATDVNNYRMYDVIGFDSKLYAVGYDWTGSDYTHDLHVSSDGAIWSKVAGVTPATNPRLVLHAGSLVGVGVDLVSVIRIDAGGAVTTYAVPFTTVAQWNVLDSDGVYVYALDNQGKVWRTQNFVTWTVYTRVGGAISIRYWPGDPAGASLIVGDVGVNARLWRAPVGN